MNSHPKDADLALLAGGDCGRVTRFLVAKHVRGCRECTAKVAHFEMLRADVSRMPAPELDWSRLAAEMKAFDFRTVVDNSTVDRLVKEGYFEKLFGPEIKAEETKRSKLALRK